MTNFSENFKDFTANRFAFDIWGDVGNDGKKALPTDISQYNEQLQHYMDLDLMRTIIGDITKNEDSSIIFEDYSRIQLDYSEDKKIKVSVQNMMPCCDILKNEINDEGFDAAMKQINSFICRQSGDGYSFAVIFKDFSIAFIENKKVIKTSDPDQNINIIFGRLFN